MCATRPVAATSGRRLAARSPRAIWGGRAVLRTALDLAAMSGVRSNPTLRAFYTRLVDAGTPKKAALTAVAHKLQARVPRVRPE